MWREIKPSDIKRGTMIRIHNMSDTAFNGGVIIAVKDNGYVRIARPMAYAHDEYDAKQPLMYAEVFEMSAIRMCEDTSDIEVFEGKNGEVYTSIT